MTETKIGLEIHAYIDVENNEKLFCDCEANINSKPNTNICPICTGQPGSKPMLPNKEALYKVIKTALMLDCNINNELLWQRKHYDWPDLPKGYQMTMSGSYSVPVGENGEFMDIGIKQCHIEEDPARWDPITGCIDYNRSGFSLIEIVTEPDFKDKEEVEEWLKKLMTILDYVGSFDKEMGVKCDVNISTSPGFERVEIKNVNSFSSIVDAINYEISRQKNQDETIEQHTRQWSEEDQKTNFMRSKENAIDYMFIPDPDIPEVKITDDKIQELKEELPEKPDKKFDKLIQKGVEETTAEVIASDIELTHLFEELSEKVGSETAANWIRKELMRLMNKLDKKWSEISIEEENILELVELVDEGKITEDVSRDILNKLSEENFSPKKYVKENDLESISEKSELESICEKVVEENTEAVEDYKEGEEDALNYLVGQVMKETQGQAQPQELKEIFKELI